ncbi:MAG: hypothetical protein JJT85_00330 [Chromatiales bacterium]|nr:hypothetical protein [Chromatiales bacterium]
MKTTVFAPVLLLLLGSIASAGEQAAALPAGAGMDRLELDAAAIRGNQELPRVMVILPWKDPAMVELSGRPVNSLVEEVLAPVDREVFQRQLRYFDQLHATREVARP